MADSLTVSIDCEKRWFFPMLQWALVVAVVLKVMTFERAARALIEHGVRITVR